MVELQVSKPVIMKFEIQYTLVLAHVLSFFLGSTGTYDLSFI